VIELSAICESCQGTVSCVTKLTGINKPKFLENCKKKHKKCSKPNTSDYENNLESENCQGFKKRLSIESLSSRHQKIALRVYISVRQMIVRTRSRTLIGSHAVEKIP